MASWAPKDFSDRRKITSNGFVNGGGGGDGGGGGEK